MTLLRAALAPSTRHNYTLSWNRFKNFAAGISQPAMPASTSTVNLFISHLYSQILAPATLISTVSAVAYMHKISNCYDPTSAFVVKKILHGANKLGAVPDKRLPITKEILRFFYIDLPSLHVTVTIQMYCFALCM